MDHLDCTQKLESISDENPEIRNLDRITNPESKIRSNYLAYMLRKEKASSAPEMSDLTVPYIIIITLFFAWIETRN